MMAHGKSLELRQIRPRSYPTAKRKNLRITADGVVYQTEGRGWRRLGRVQQNTHHELDNLMRRAA